MLVKVYHDHFASLFFGGLESGGNTSFTHNSFSIAKLLTDCIFRILMPEFHSMRVDSDNYFRKTVKDSPRRALTSTRIDVSVLTSTSVQMRFSSVFLKQESIAT